MNNHQVVATEEVESGGSFTTAEIIERILSEEGEKLQSDFKELLDVSQPSISYALGQLEEEGTVERERRGRKKLVRYTAETGEEVSNIELFDQRSDSLADIKKVFPLDRQASAKSEFRDMSAVEIVADYILTSEDDYTKAKFLADDLEDKYGRSFSTKELGAVLPNLANEVDLSAEEYKEEFKTGFTNSTTWRLAYLRENYGEDLEELLEDENRGSEKDSRKHFFEDIKMPSSTLKEGERDRDEKPNEEARKDLQRIRQIKGSGRDKETENGRTSLDGSTEQEIVDSIHSGENVDEINDSVIDSYKLKLSELVEPGSGDEYWARDTESPPWRIEDLPRGLDLNSIKDTYFLVEKKGTSRSGQANAEIIGYLDEESLEYV